MRIERRNLAAIVFLSIAISCGQQNRPAPNTFPKEPNQKSTVLIKDPTLLKPAKLLSCLRMSFFPTDSLKQLAEGISGNNLWVVVLFDERVSSGDTASLNSTVGDKRYRFLFHKNLNFFDIPLQKAMLVQADFVKGSNEGMLFTSCRLITDKEAQAHLSVKDYQAVLAEVQAINRVHGVPVMRSFDGKELLLRP
jgi:hypothetical protein